MKEDGIELSEDFIVLAIPRETVEVEIKAKIYHDGELLPVSKKMGMEEVREAFRKAETGYIDEDAEFVLTDKAKEFLTALHGG